jgi:hypothetical protein
MERIVSINNIFIVKVCTAPMFLLLLSHKRRCISYTIPLYANNNKHYLARDLAFDRGETIY